MEATLTAPGRLTLAQNGTRLAEYAFLPHDDRTDSPRPRLALRTRDGRPVTADAPPDHPWHRGLSLALPHVGRTTFWGGPSRLPDVGYRMLANHGTQRHLAWAADPEGLSDEGLRIEERLDWIDERERPILSETRSLELRIVDEDAWTLGWRSTLTNTTDEPLTLGSPATGGRGGAGYGGIFWRGADSFRGGEVVGPDGPVDEEAARGGAATWLALLSSARDAAVLAADPEGTPASWFVRSADYPGMGIAPFAHAELSLAPSRSVSLAMTLAITGTSVATANPGARLADLARAAAGARTGSGVRPGVTS